MASIKKAFDLTGKTALVTGGSRGLGLQIAEALGEQGARIVLSSRTAADLKQAQEHLAGLGIKSDWIAADNAVDDDIQRLATAMSKLGRVDILVNNAGAAWAATTEDHPIEAWDNVINLNIRSLFLLSQRMAIDKLENAMKVANPRTIGEPKVANLVDKPGKKAMSR